jgi:hypothetical protein
MALKAAEHDPSRKSAGIKSLDEELETNGLLGVVS